MITAEEYKDRVARGQTEILVLSPTDFGASPVMQVQVSKVTPQAGALCRVLPMCRPIL